MKKEFKLHEVCSSKQEDLDIRPCFNYIYFDQEYAWATNAKIAIRIRTEFLLDENIEQIEYLKDKYIHRDMYKKILSWKDEIDIKEDCIQNKKTKESVPVLDISEPEWKYPNIQEIFKAESKLNEQLEDVPPFVGINASLLSRLSLGMGEKELLLCMRRSYDDDNYAYPIFVLGGMGNERIPKEEVLGLIMPLIHK